VIAAVLRERLAEVPARNRVPRLERAVLRVADRLQAIPWAVADLPRERQRERLAAHEPLLREALMLARELFEADGYGFVALVLYGALAGLLGRPHPQVLADAAWRDAEALAPSSEAVDG
jgi:hypothetical protein